MIIVSETFSSTLFVQLPCMFCCAAAVQYLEKCPRGWTEFGKSCYQVFKGEFNWYKSVAVCSLYDSHAATLKSEEDLVSLSKPLPLIHNITLIVLTIRLQAFFSMDLMIKEDSVSTAWLGVSDTRTEGVFRNVDLSKFPEDIWAPGQPRSLSPEDDCLLWDDSDLNDTDCLSVAQSVICERPTLNLNACPPNYARFFGSS